MLVSWPCRAEGGTVAAEPILQIISLLREVGLAQALVEPALMAVRPGMGQVHVVVGQEVTSMEMVWAVLRVGVALVSSEITIHSAGMVRFF